MSFTRRDDGPRRLVGKYTVVEDNVTLKKKIRVFTGPRKALRCGKFG
jgi:hypothetical protein